MKITKKSLCDNLSEIGINPKGTLFVHSSMKAIGECENGADTVIDAFIEFMHEGLLIFPTHTWDCIGIKKNIFEPASDLSCVGILSNLFLNRPGVVRSLHPTHSVAAIGKDAVDYTNGEELSTTPCSKNGCYGKLYDRKAQILFLGCELSKNTFLHGVEEWNRIPARLDEIPIEFYIKTPNGQLSCTQYRHCRPNGLDVSTNYIKMEPAFIENRIGRYGIIGNAHSVLCDAVGMADLVGAYLKYVPDLFGDSRLLTEYEVNWPKVRD